MGFEVLRQPLPVLLSFGLRIVLIAAAVLFSSILSPEVAGIALDGTEWRVV